MYKCLICDSIKTTKWYKNKTQCRKCYRKEPHIMISERDYRLQYNKKNRKKLSEKYKQRLHTDINFKLSHNLRKRLTKAIKGGYKKSSAVKDLGCSVEYFRQYLESKFQTGMTWENYGKWHIDHILPLSKFDLTIKENIKKLCHYTNLQPLWAEDNRKKSNNYVSN